MVDYRDIRKLAATARQRIVEISPAQARQEVERGALLVDVRDESELMRNPPISGALHLSRGQLEYLITEAVESRDEAIVLYCGGGNRGALATASLCDLGYTRVFNVRGGLRTWYAEQGRRWIANEVNWALLVEGEKPSARRTSR